MPTYLCHGFRWHRRSIRYYVVIQNVDDAAPEWIVAPHSSVALLESFYDLFDFLPSCSRPRLSPSNSRIYDNHQLYLGKYEPEPPPDDSRRTGRKREADDKKRGKRSLSRKRSRSQIRIPKSSRRESSPPPPLPLLPDQPVLHPDEEDDVLINDWSSIKLLEEYDPANVDQVSGPHAYVADYVVRVDTSVSIFDEIAKYEERMRNEPREDRAMSGPTSDETGRKIATAGSKKAGWFEKLRDQLQRAEEIKWYMVVCADEDRNDHDPVSDDDSSSNVDTGILESEPSSRAPTRQDIASERDRGREKEQKLPLENGDLEYRRRLQDLAGLRPQQQTPSSQNGSFEYRLPDLAFPESKPLPLRIERNFSAPLINGGRPHVNGLSSTPPPRVERKPLPLRNNAEFHRPEPRHLQDVRPPPLRLDRKQRRENGSSGSSSIRANGIPDFPHPLALMSSADQNSAPPAVPEKDLPMLPPASPSENGTYGHRPKTPSRNGIRRFFSKTSRPPENAI